MDSYLDESSTNMELSSVSDSGSQNGSSSPPILLVSSSSNFTHPVSNKPIPTTAIVMKNVAKVSTPGTSRQADNNTIADTISLPDSPGSSSRSDVDSQTPPPRSYMTNKKKKELKKQMTHDKKELYEKACDEIQKGMFPSIFAASKHYNLSYGSLYKYLVHGDSYTGKGRKSQVLTPEEEQKIADHVVYRQQIGCGMTFYQLQLLIQEVLVAVIASRPDRSSPYADNGHFPNLFFARRFAARHNLTLRATMEISKGRQILSVDDLIAWQKDTEAGLVNNELVAECFEDGNRVFNQDETSVQVGSGSSKVLAAKGTKVLYNFSGSSREHVTASYTVSASGDCVPVRLVYKGVRNMAAQHLKDFPTNGKSGIWKFGVTANGYVTREAFIDILKDLDEYLESNNVKRPVILFMDGQKGHISLEAASFCKLKQIQPWLLRANMTHLLQPLDLTFFNSLKKKLSYLAHTWHADPKNAGQTLSKYSIMWCLHEATEMCLSNPSIISNGFKRAGLFPWDPNAQDRTKLLPGSVYASSTPPLTDSSSTASSAPTPPLSDNIPQADTDNLAYTVPLDDIISPQVINDSTSASGTASIDVYIADPTDDDIPSFSPSLADNEETFNNSEFEPPLSSTFSEVTDIVDMPDQSHPYWYKKTQICPTCDRRILNNLFATHLNNCGTACSSKSQNIEVSSEPQFNVSEMSVGQADDMDIPCNEEIKLSSIPSYTLDDRADQLTKFEVLLLTKSQVMEFEDMFKKKEFINVKEPLYKAWLHLKFAAAGTETEAIDRLFSSKIAKSVQKRKTKRKDTQPSGPARYVLL